MIRTSQYTLIGSLLLGLTCAQASGCAAVKATQQPSQRDLSVLEQGKPRTHVIAELGAPVWSDRYHNGNTVDVFSFKQGYKKSTKAARAFAHGAADVMTVGLWEVVGIPTETMIDGTDVQLEVHYGPQQTVERVVVIKGEKAMNPPKPFALASRAAPPSEPRAGAPANSQTPDPTPRAIMAGDARPLSQASR
jgi:outer membrane protein assembly factor BamE (lipoprotein component of BamABCDE complex)